MTLSSRGVLHVARMNIISPIFTDIFKSSLRDSYSSHPVNYNFTDLQFNENPCSIQNFCFLRLTTVWNLVPTDKTHVKGSEAKLTDQIGCFLLIIVHNSKGVLLIWIVYFCAFKSLFFHICFFSLLHSNCCEEAAANQKFTWSQSFICSTNTAKACHI